MKKTVSRLLLTLALCCVLAAPALAVPALAAELDMVTDQALCLTDEEYSKLNNLAAKISEQYQCGVYIVTVDDMGDDDAYDFAKLVYEEYDLGYGPDKSGLLFFLSMAKRDYALVAYGYGNTAFTDHGKDTLLKQYVLPRLSEDKYYEAFTAYLNTSGEYLAMARDGSPFDVDTDPEHGKSQFWIKLAITILLPLLIAGAVCLFWKSRMKTAVAARAADHYIPDGGFQLTGQEDLFLFETETRQQIEEKSLGGTSIDSDGASGCSGKF